MSATSDARSDEGDIRIEGGEVHLRAERRRRARTRTYTITATAVDRAGNHAGGSATCRVPGARRRGH